MASPRITVVTLKNENDEATSVNLYVNPEGRDLLVRELSRLSEKSDHFHMDAAEWAIEVPLQTTAYDPGAETIASNVKIMFRSDDWDREYFPHVMMDP